MKKKPLPLITALVFVVCCALGLAACGKELNYLKADNGDGQLKTQFDLGTFSADELDEVKTKLSLLTFYYEYYPDNSIEKADMSQVKVKYFVGSEGGHEGLPEQLKSGNSYKVCYYYTGHEPTADFSDSFVVSIDFWVE